MNPKIAAPKVALALCLAACGGCSILGAAAYKLSPPVAVEAKYTLAPEPLLIVVERSENPGDARADAARIIQYVREVIVSRNLAPVVEPRTIDFTQSSTPLRQVGDPPAAPTVGAKSPASQSAQDSRPANGAPQQQPFDPFRNGGRRFTGPAAQGRASGAKQVLFVELVSFDVEPATGSDRVKGGAEARVRVIDATTGEVRWPTDTSQGYPISVTTSWVGLDSRSGDYPIRDQICKDISDRVSKLFHKWTSEQIDTGSPQ